MSTQQTQPNWQVTAATLRCEAVDDDVTVLVYKDWSVKCTGQSKYGAAKETRKRGKTVRCQGPDCATVTGYRRKLQGEEAGRKAG